MLIQDLRTVHKVHLAFTKLKNHLIANQCDPDGQYYIQCIEDDILAILKGDLLSEELELQDFIDPRD